MEFSHIPVLLEQAVDALAVKENGIYVDGTAGGGGHSSEILSRLTTGKLISIDQDPDAILTLTERFKKNENSIIIKGNFADMVSLLHSRGVGRVDGVLLDIGVSSHQLDTAERGFSFHEDAPLDMRMSQSGTTAAELVNTLPAGELRRILSVYGEEKFAGAIVNGIVKARAEKPIETTLELAEIIKENVISQTAIENELNDMGIDRKNEFEKIAEGFLKERCIFSHDYEVRVDNSSIKKSEPEKSIRIMRAIMEAID